MKKIKLTKGEHALIDDEDYLEISRYKWFLGNDGYARRNLRKSNGKQKSILMHRVIMKSPNRMDTDHINHVGTDNRKKNLRIVTRSQNLMNCLPHKNTSSKYKGVYWHKRDHRWVAAMKINGRQKFLGYFKKETDAAKTYNKMAEKINGEFACLNKV